MGLFDTIHCDHPLPDACTATEFQTKSLGCGLDTYRLTAAGHLPDPQGTDKGAHGVLRLYTSDAGGHWWEYEAKFTDGQLVHLLPKAHAQYSEDGLLMNDLLPAQNAAPTP
jgi:hypothetical protein